MTVELSQIIGTIAGDELRDRAVRRAVELVTDLFDPSGRRGAPAVIPRRAMVEALLFICRTGRQWR